MTHIGFDCSNRPTRYAKGLGELAQNFRFSNPILRCSGAMGLHKRIVAQAFFANHVFGGCQRLGHGEIVTHAWAGNGFLEAIGMDKNVVDCTIDRGACFQR